jgi:hypothetical protein
VSDFFAPPPKPRSYVEITNAPRSPFEPPSGVLPAVVDTGRILARKAEVTVAMTRLWVYPEGFEVALLIDLADEESELDPFESRARRRGQGRPDPTEGLHFGFGFADGSRATNVVGMRPAADDGSRPPSLMERGGGGDGSGFHHSFWLSPLGAGPIEVAFEWLAAEIEFTTTDLDPEAIAAAALRAEPVFAAEEDA